MKLPKIRIDYDKAAYPLDGSTVLIHCEETAIDPFHNLSPGVVEAHFELDGEDSYWVVHSNPDELCVTPTHYTPMPKFKETKDLNNTPKFQRVEPIVSKQKATYYNGGFLIASIFGPLVAKSNIVVTHRLSGAGSIHIHFDSGSSQLRETLALERQDAINLANALMSAAQDMKE